MNFPSLASAEAYLRDKLQDFYNQRAVLQLRLRSIVQLKEAAIKKDDQQALGQLIVLRQGVLNLLQEHVEMENRLEPFRSYFGVSFSTAPSLGALPLILAGGAIAIATSLYLYYEKLQVQGKALEMVAKGLLPASQAEAILNPSFFSGIGGSFAQVGMLAIGGIFLFLFLTRRTS